MWSPKRTTRALYLFVYTHVIVTAGKLSQVPPEIFGTARMANTIAGQLGVCGFKPSVLLDILAGKIGNTGALEAEVVLCVRCNGMVL